MVTTSHNWVCGPGAPGEKVQAKFPKLQPCSPTWDFSNLTGKSQNVVLSDNNTTELVETGKSPWGNKRDHLESKTPGLGWPEFDNTAMYCCFEKSKRNRLSSNSSCSASLPAMLLVQSIANLQDRGENGDRQLIPAGYDNRRTQRSSCGIRTNN